MPRDARSPLVRSAAVALDARPDRDLLARFAADRDDAAFAALVRRHGPLVLAVCRRHLGNAADAEDAFQAVFLVLAKKADAVRWGVSARGWVYRVAVRVAKDARNRRAVRLRHERAAALHPRANPVEQPDFAAALDAELAELPDKYRDVLVACCLDGKSRDEAAADLGVPAGTVKIRLERGRELLRKRLTARGVEFGAALAAATVAADAVAGAVVGTTSRAAAAWLAGDAGAVPAAGQLLANGACRAMFVQKIRAIALGFVAVAAVVAGVGVVFGPGTPVDPTPPAAALAPVPEDKLKPGQIAVSKPDKNGLVTVLRPLVTHLAPGDPVRIALHFETEKGPLAEDKLPNGDPVPSFTTGATSQTFQFTVTTPGGDTLTLRSGTPPVPGAEPVIPLPRHAGWFFVLDPDAPRLEPVAPRLRDVLDWHAGTGVWAPWKDGVKADLSKPGRYSVAVRGELRGPKDTSVPFAAGPVVFERLKPGAATFADLEKTAKAALPEGTKFGDPKFRSDPQYSGGPPLVVDDPAGNRTVFLRGEDKGPWYYVHHTVVVDRDGKAGKPDTADVSTCVARGTLLDGEAGPLPVERVRIGDRVWGYDPAAGKRVLVTVRGVAANVAEETLVFGNALRVTGNHPVFASGGWKRADAVGPTDALLGRDGSPTPAGTPDRVRGAIDVFDITVDGPHTYFAGGFLVHNKDRKVKFTLEKSAYYQLWPAELPAKK